MSKNILAVAMLCLLLPVTSTADVCGDSLMTSLEGCDDGNTVDGDGCSSVCQVEANYSCSAAVPSTVNGVLDGGFESAVPNLFWAESSTNLPTPLCTVATCGSISGTVGPSSGDWFAWFGGLDVTEFSSVQQSFTIEPTDTTLSFDVSAPRCDKPQDFARVLLDGNELFRMDSSDTSCFTVGYRTIAIDLATAPGGPYNDGASHTLLAESQVFGTNIFSSNFLIDEFQIDRQATPKASECTLHTNVPVPDFNSNGSPEIAVLVSGSNQVVRVRDASASNLISSIDFGPDPAIAVSVIDDVSGNGVPEIAVLGIRPAGAVRVQIKDALTGASVNDLFYGSAFVPVDMAVLPDSNGNGAAELAVLGRSASGGVRVQARDALTGLATSTTYYGSNARPIDVVVIPDVSGNDAPEIVVQGLVTASNQARAQMRDSSSGAFLRNLFFGSAYRPQKLTVVPDLSGDGIPDLAQLASRPDTGAVRVQVKSTSDGATISNAYLGNTDVAMDVVGIDDVSGNGYADTVTLVKRPDGTAKGIVRDGMTGDFVRNLFFGTIENPASISVLSDYNGNGIDEIAVHSFSGESSDVEVRDPESTDLVKSLLYYLHSLALTDTQFMAAIGDSNVIDFEGIADPGGFEFLGSPGSFGQDGVGITSNSPIFLQNNDVYGTGAFLSPQQSNPERVDIVLPPGTAAAGFSYQSDEMNVRVNGGLFISMPAVPSGSLGFFGVTSIGEIRTLEISVFGPGIDIDNLIISDSVPNPP